MALSLTSSLPLGVDGDGNHCQGNCSGHGSCQDGQCICLVQFAGGRCHEVNAGYYIAFGSIFVLLGCVALVQLVLCMRYEYVKDDKRSWRRACQLTVQKLLYLLVIFATAIRGAYFFTMLQQSNEAVSGLWSAYFPVIITGFSLIVCFWAEAFHISASPQGERQFLSKSTIFFIAFNLLQYLVLATQLVVSKMVTDPHDKALVLRVCNGGFALLMIVVVVFFLIYGVEVYFKVRGAFRGTESGLDTWQLHMSRLGLVAQAALQLITALFLVADVASDVWRDKLPILSLNFYDIGFRVVEFGVALWFPCVLWNCGRPEELWVLNPKRIFRSFHFHRHDKTGGAGGEEQPIQAHRPPSPQYSTFSADLISLRADCWICYDPERSDMGPLIQPCVCKGDVATVHHDCLKKWLVESAANESSPVCRVCGERYKLEAHYWIPTGLKPRHWLQTFLALLLLIGSPFAAYSICHSLSPSASTYIYVLVIGTTVLLELLALRMFIMNGRSSCQRTRVATMRIAGREIHPSARTHSLRGANKDGEGGPPTAKAQVHSPRKEGAPASMTPKHSPQKEGAPAQSAGSPRRGSSSGEREIANTAHSHSPGKEGGTDVMGNNAQSRGSWEREIAHTPQTQHSPGVTETSGGETQIDSSLNSPRPTSEERQISPASSALLLPSSASKGGNCCLATNDLDITPAIDLPGDSISVLGAGSVDDLAATTLKVTQVSKDLNITPLPDPLSEESLSVLGAGSLVDLAIGGLKVARVSLNYGSCEGSSESCGVAPY